MPRPTGSWGLLQLFYSGLFGSRWENLIWLKPDSSLPSAFDVQACASALYGIYGTAVQALMNENNTILGCRFYVNNGVYTASADVQTLKPGTLTDGALPPDDFIVVRSQASVAGRNGKGRLLMGGIDISLQTSGRVNSTGDTAMAAFLAVLTAPQTAGGVSWNVQQYDHKNNVLHLPEFFSYNPVLGNKKKRSPIL